MRGGRLRKLVTIERVTNSTDSRGELIEGTPTTLGPYWAGVEPISSREREALGQLAGEVTHTITLRGGGGLTIYPTDRIKLGSRTFQLVGPSIDWQERGRELRVPALETPNQGV